jgi:hypothetical protein
MKEESNLTDEDRLQHAKTVITVFGKLEQDLLMPCIACHREAKDCPSAQCKSDMEITVCQAKTMFMYVCTTLEYLSGKKVEFTETLKEDSYA